MKFKKVKLIEDKQVKKSEIKKEEDNFNKRFDTKFGTDTQVFTFEEYKKRMQEMKDFK